MITFFAVLMVSFLLGVTALNTLIVFVILRALRRDGRR